MNDQSRDDYVHLTFKFSANAMTAFEALAERVKASSLSEVIRDALRFYDFLKRQADNGYKIHLVKGGRAKELLLDDATSPEDAKEASLRMKPGGDVIRLLPKLRSMEGRTILDLSDEIYRRLQEIQRTLEKDSLDETLETILKAFSHE